MAATALLVVALSLPVLGPLERTLLRLLGKPVRGGGCTAGRPAHFDLARGEILLESSGQHLDALSLGWDSVDCWYRAEGEAPVDALEPAPPSRPESRTSSAAAATHLCALDYSECGLASGEVAVGSAPPAPPTARPSRCDPEVGEHGLADRVVAVDGAQSPPLLASPRASLDLPSHGGPPLGQAHPCPQPRAAGDCRGLRAAAGRPCTARPRIAVSTLCSGCSSVLRRKPPGVDVALTEGLRGDLVQDVWLSVPVCELCAPPVTPCFVRSFFQHQQRSGRPAA